MIEEELTLDSIDKNLELDLKRYVPLSELKTLTSKWEGEEVTSRTKEEVINRLNVLILKHRGEEILDEITQLVTKYKFAGKCAISWSIPKEESEEESEEELIRTNNFKKYIEQSFINHCETNPFECAIRPPVDDMPRLNRAGWLTDNLLKIEYIYAGKKKIIEEDYDEPREIRPTMRSVVLVRLIGDSFVIECRDNYQTARKLHKITSQILHKDVEIITFSDEDIEAIKRDLNGKKKGARLKRSGGDFDTVEVTASPILDDLDESPEYNVTFKLKDDEIREARFLIPYEAEGKTSEISIKINNNGSVWFMSMVPEEVVNYVLSCIKRVKCF